MPLGLKSAPAILQRALSIVLSSEKRQSCLKHLEDVMTYSMTEEEHIGLVDCILRLLRDVEEPL